PVQPAAQAEEGLAGVPGPDLAGVHEAAALGGADEQGPEADPGALRLGEAAEDELLPAQAHDLHPGRVAAADGPAAEPLAEDPLLPPATCLPEQGLTLALAELAPADPVRPHDGLAEEPLALPERLGGQVAAVEPEQVEEEDRRREPLRPGADLSGVGAAPAPAPRLSGRRRGHR